MGSPFSLRPHSSSAAIEPRCIEACCAPEPDKAGRRAMTLPSLAGLAVAAVSLAAVSLHAPAVQAATLHVLDASSDSGSTCSAAATANTWGALACRLTGLLHILYLAAAILSFVLIVVIVVALRIYHQNKMATEDGQP